MSIAALGARGDARAWPTDTLSAQHCCASSTRRLRANGRLFCLHAFGTTSLLTQPATPRERAPRDETGSGQDRACVGRGDKKGRPLLTQLKSRRTGPPSLRLRGRDRFRSSWLSWQLEKRRYLYQRDSRQLDLALVSAAREGVRQVIVHVGAAALGAFISDRLDPGQQWPGSAAASAASTVGPNNGHCRIPSRRPLSARRPRPLLNVVMT